jgi:DNA polymerase-1
MNLTEWTKNWDGGPVGFDTETTSLDWYKLEIEGFSLYDGNNAIYIDLIGLEPSALMMQLDKLMGVLNSAKLVIGQNLAYDLGVLKKYGLEVYSPIFDTQVASFILNENKPCDLKHNTKTILRRNVVKYDDVAALDHSGPEFASYGRADAINTYDLWTVFAPQIEREGLGTAFYKIDMPFIHVLVDLKVNGIAVDLKEHARIQGICEKTLLEYKSELHDLANVSYEIVDGEFESFLNLNSSDDLVMVIEGMGIEITEMTKGGTKPNKKTGKVAPPKKSVGIDSLNKMDQTPFVILIKKYKKLQKIYSSFVLPFLDFVDPDGRIRPSFNNTVAVTQRLSCSKPNLQQLPRDSSEFGFNFRDIFISEKGNLLVVSDYEGQELKILGDLTHDPRILAIFNDNLDMHLMLANKMLKLGIPEEMLNKAHPEYEAVKKKFKLQRYKAKNGVNFPIIYGTTAFGVAKYFMVPERVAQGYIDSFFELFPEVLKAMYRCNMYLRQNKFVKNREGRRRRFKYDSPKAQRQSFNFKIQGTAASMIKAAMSLVRKAIRKHPEWGAKIVLTVHDEIVIECLSDQAERVLEVLEWCMINAYKLSIPLTVESAIGPNYGECK